MYNLLLSSNAGNRISWWKESSNNVDRETLILIWLGSALLVHKYRNCESFQRKLRSYWTGTPYAPLAPLAPMIAAPGRGSWNVVVRVLWSTKYQTPFSANIFSYYRCDYFRIFYLNGLFSTYISHFQIFLSKWEYFRPNHLIFKIFDLNRVFST